MRRKHAAVVAAALFGCAVSSCREAALGSFPQAPVVLVSIDTLRADRLPAYGYARGRTPVLDALAREAVVFDDVVSPCPLTLPAHASLLTGLWPPRHQVRDNVGFSLGPERETLATRFHAAGRPTGAAVSAFVLRAATGIARGFDRFDDALPVDAAVSALGAQQRDGALSVESLLAWIASHPRTPFFAFLHLYEPHTPYVPPERHRQLPDPYDGEIAYADELVGRLLDGLRRAGAYDSAIIVVTADHGEGLGDHGEAEHGFFLYREALRVPLFVRLPGGRYGGTRVAGVVRLVDIPATLLDLTGLAATELDGRSLREAMTTGKLDARTAYAETLYPRFHFGWSELLAASDDRFSYVRAPRPELYDLKADPGETRNLAGERPAAVAGMNAWLDRVVGETEPEAPRPAAPEVVEALRALGYVGGAAPSRALPAGEGRADPKDKIEVYETFRKASSHRQLGDEARAVAELRRVVAAEPAMLDAWEELGGALLRLGQDADGIAALEKALAGDPERATTHLALARAHGYAGRKRPAIQHATAASARDPGQAFELLAQMALSDGRFQDAGESARRSLAADPRRALSHFVLGVLAQRDGRYEAAVTSFRRAADAQALQLRLVIPGLHARLGDCLARLGRAAEAEAEFRAEIAAIPHTREGRIGLALLLRSQGRDVEAREVVAGIVTANPRPGPDEYALVVRTLQGIGDEQASRAWAARARQRLQGDRQ